MYKRKDLPFGVTCSTVFVRPKQDPAPIRERIKREKEFAQKKLKLALHLHGLHPAQDADGPLVYTIKPSALRKLGVVVFPRVQGIAA